MTRAVLFALAACAAPQSIAPAPCTRTVVRVVTLVCGEYSPPQPPSLLLCDDPLDLTPGSCPNINRSRRLDYAQQLEQYTDYVAATCQLLDKPTWGSR